MRHGIIDSNSTDLGIGYLGVLGDVEIGIDVHEIVVEESQLQNRQNNQKLRLLTHVVY